MRQARASPAAHSGESESRPQVPPWASRKAGMSPGGPTLVSPCSQAHRARPRPSHTPASQMPAPLWSGPRIQSLGGADYSYTNMVPSPKVQLGGGYSDGGDAMPSQFRRAWRLRHAIHVMAAKGCPKEWRPRPGPAVTTPSLPPSRSPPSSQDSKPQTAEYAAVPSPSQACTRMGWTRVQAAADTERPRAC